MHPRLAFALCSLTSVLPAAPVAWVPDDLLPPPPGEGPALCVGRFLKPEEGERVLKAALERFPDHESWHAYVQHARTRIQEAAGLSPWPARTPLKAVVRKRRDYDGYSVENVVFESVPGYFVTGSLYRPLTRNRRMRRYCRRTDTIPP